MQLTQIDNVDFARKQQTIDGEVSVAQMPRLLEAISSGQEGVDVMFTLSGGELHAMPAITIDIQADLSVPCQRCFEPIPQSLQLTFDYVISDEEPEGLDELDEVDWVEPEQSMDILTLIEDELLLALPFAPVHEDDCGAGQYESGERVSPFAVLKGKFK